MHHCRKHFLLIGIYEIAHIYDAMANNVYNIESEVLVYVVLSESSKKDVIFA